ncbi:2-thiouracil desulfurase family protein [Streptomyces sp. RS2]|uniref:DUF523 domain-containing protein n=1 Tax=Streptomyces sp. RS2 TaxID=1451205 RepID=UPI0027E2C263|nr:2-thiouracil desulfurase family protein [Streptomyces sp. RS2]
MPVSWVGGCGTTGVPSRSGGGVVGRWWDEGRVVVFCPEVSGGVARAEGAGGDRGRGGGADVLDGVARVLTASGEDVSRQFVRGARLALDAARAAGVRVALLKESSPSCGSLRVYDGRFAGDAGAGAWRHHGAVAAGGGAGVRGGSGCRGGGLPA